MHVIRNLEADTETCRSHGDSEIAPDTQVQGELRFDAELVDGDEQLIRAVAYDHGSSIDSPLSFDKRQRWADTLVKVVGNASDPKEDIRPGPRVRPVVD